MNAPATLNGHPVIASAPRPNSDADSLIVVVYRGVACADPYVVASWHPSLGDAWCWGHYFRTLPMAAGYFAERTGQPTFAEA